MIYHLDPLDNVVDRSLATPVVNKLQKNGRRMRRAFEQRSAEDGHKLLGAALADPDVSSRKRELGIVRVHTKF
jgi:hypothetical protein